LTSRELKTRAAGKNLSYYCRVVSIRSPNAGKFAGVSLCLAGKQAGPLGSARTRGYSYAIIKVVISFLLTHKRKFLILISLKKHVHYYEDMKFTGDETYGNIEQLNIPLHFW